MAEHSHQLVQKLRNYCNILRDDGLSYGGYASTRLSTGSEQLMFSLFLKMADEQQGVLQQAVTIPKSLEKTQREPKWQRRLAAGSLEPDRRRDASATIFVA